MRSSCSTPASSRLPQCETVWRHPGIEQDSGDGAEEELRFDDYIARGAGGINIWRKRRSIRSLNNGQSSAHGRRISM